MLVNIGAEVVLVDVASPLTGCGTVTYTVGKQLGAENNHAGKFGMTWLVPNVDLRLCRSRTDRRLYLWQQCHTLWIYHRGLLRGFTIGTIMEETVFNVVFTDCG